MFDFMFFFNNILLGIGLAMDAFSVSLANGLNEPCMKKSKTVGIAAVFAFFQALMPLIGWLCVHTIVQYFQAFETFIPWIALVLLSVIGGKMLYDGIKNKDECPCEKEGLGISALLVQGVATSIDALSVGFTIASYDIIMALCAVLLIGAVTFGVCLLGVILGKKFGTHFAGKASVFGGSILILIGLEILITSFF